MTRGQRRSLVRRLHSGVGWLLAGLLVLMAATGILLQHPAWLGGPDNAPLCVAIDPTDANHILRGTHWGVEVSEDGGRQWREVSMLAPPTDVVRVLFVAQAAAEPMVFALGRDGLVASRDGGWVWHEEALPTAEMLAGAVPLDLAVDRDGRLRLLTSGGSFSRGAAGTWLALGGGTAAGRDWHRWAHDLHTGYLAGSVGRRVAEGGAWGLILLVLTGLVLQGRARGRGRS